MTTAETTKDLKFCDTCVQYKPLTEFRKRWGDKYRSERMNKCRECHNAAEREYRLKRKKKRQARELNQFAAKVARERDHRRVEILCAVMTQKFGGLQGLVEAWMLHVDHARANEPGSKKVLDFFRCVARLAEAASQKPRIMPQDLSDEDLRFAMKHVVRQVMEEDAEAERCETYSPTSSPV